jgi:hypothetical protein
LLFAPTPPELTRPAARYARSPERRGVFVYVRVLLHVLGYS